MHDKDEILRQIASLAEKGAVTRHEIIKAYDDGRLKTAPSGSSVDVSVAVVELPPETKTGETPFFKQTGVAEILFYIGGGIVFLGLVFMVGQNWSALGPAGRMLVTLGAGIGAYYAGLVLSRDNKTERMAPAFFLISALIMPVGLYVIFDTTGLEVSGYGYQSLISGIMLVVYLASYFIYRKSIFVLFGILYGTWLFFSVTSYFFSSGLPFDEEDFYLYRALAAGLAYLFMAHSLAKTDKASITVFLNNFGLVGFLGAALALGGWEPSQNIFWEVFYPGIVFAVLFLSVKVKSKAYLAWGAIFLMLFIIKTTNEYFTTGMGWPVTLIITGLLLIGVGYMTISIKRKYLSIEL